MIEGGRRSYGEALRSKRAVSTGVQTEENGGVAPSLGADQMLTPKTKPGQAVIVSSLYEA